MNMKQALTILAMNREGKSKSAAEVREAQQVSGHTIGELRTGHVNPRIAKSFGDDEDLTDTKSGQVA